MSHPDPPPCRECGGPTILRQTTGPPRWERWSFWFICPQCHSCCSGGSDYSGIWLDAAGRPIPTPLEVP